jgi:hypothetical protein
VCVIHACAASRIPPFQARRRTLKRTTARSSPDPAGNDSDPAAGLRRSAARTCAVRRTGGRCVYVCACACACACVCVRYASGRGGGDVAAVAAGVRARARAWWRWRRRRRWGFCDCVSVVRWPARRGGADVVWLRRCWSCLVAVAPVYGFTCTHGVSDMGALASLVLTGWKRRMVYTRQSRLPASLRLLEVRIIASAALRAPVVACVGVCVWWRRNAAVS